MRWELWATGAALVSLGLGVSVGFGGEPGGRALAAEARGSVLPSVLPSGVSPVLYKLMVPEGHEPRPDQVQLGDRLFRDKRLSSDGTVACSTCHDPDKGFVDGKTVSEGVGKQKGQRNSPTVLNAMFNATQFWDGRAASLEEQARLPIINPIEMGMKDGAAVEGKLREIPEYRDAFQKVFGRAIEYDDVAAAIAAFERTQYSGNAPFDRYILGDETALSPAARRGWTLFNGKARCNECHAANAVSPLFSDQKFHNIGIAARKQDFTALAKQALGVVRAGDQKQIDELAIQTKFSELGRFLVTKRENEIGAFKTPNLRNVGVTAPYMHDGSFATLWDVMDHYNKGGITNPYIDGGIQRLGLTEREIDDLVELMFALTDDRYATLGRAEHARQERLKSKRPERDMAAATGAKGDLGDVGVDAGRKDPAELGVFSPEVQAGAAKSAGGSTGGASAAPAASPAPRKRGKR